MVYCKIKITIVCITMINIPDLLAARMFFDVRNNREHLIIEEIRGKKRVCGGEKGADLGGGTA